MAGSIPTNGSGGPVNSDRSDNHWAGPGGPAQLVQLLPFLANISPRQHGIRMICSRAGELIARRGGTDMHFEAEGNRKTQLMALLMTVVVVGGSIAWAMTA